MRKSILQILSVVLATSLASLAPAQPSRAMSSEKAAGPGEFLLSWSLSDPAELDHAAKRLELAEARFKRGELQKDELEEMRIQMSRFVKNAHALLTIRSGGGPLSAFLAAARFFSCVRHSALALQPQHLLSPSKPYPPTKSFPMRN